MRYIISFIILLLVVGVVYSIIDIDSEIKYRTDEGTKCVGKTCTKYLISQMGNKSAELINHYNKTGCDIYMKNVMNNKTFDTHMMRNCFWGYFNISGRK